MVTRGLTMRNLRCGVVGVGQLGQHHVRIYRELHEVDLVGIYDSDPERMGEIARTYGTRPYQSLERLLDDVEVISLVVPTRLHFEIGKMVLAKDCHVLIEKPIATAIEEANDLIRRAHSKGVVLYVGHTERFAPSFRCALKYIKGPRFIEALRLAGFGLRGTDVSVIHDLMIHDIDLVLSTAESEIDKVDAIGVPVFTPNVDIANARLHFKDGTIASLTASRVSIERLRKLRLFQEDAYISIDFLKRDAKVYRRKVKAADLEAMASSSVDMQDLVEVMTPPVEDKEPLMLEIEDFIASVRGIKQPEVPGEDGARALEVATEIVKDIECRLAMWR